jgi:hypothetical protein
MVPVRAVQSFEFIAEAPLDVVAPLFGADRERVWAEAWAPCFVWPSPPADREGMVFTLDHDGRTAVWVNTGFDLAAGRFQYVYVIPERLVTRILIALTPHSHRTGVHVTYERTALAPEANDQVEELAAGDAVAGPEWAAAINGYLVRPAGVATAANP